VEEVSVSHEHFHIRWSAPLGSKLDWEAFTNKDDAEGRAVELVRPDESYTIEQFDGNCPVCPGATGNT
jgi:hypothetical protein